jgi:hypothetical protein
LNCSNCSSLSPIPWAPCIGVDIRSGLTALTRFFRQSRNVQMIVQQPWSHHIYYRLRSLWNLQSKQSEW